MDSISQEYKKTALGVIPQDWKIMALGNLVSITSGESPSSYHLKSYGKYPFIKVEDMNNCDKYQNKGREYSDDERNIISLNSIIFPKRGAAISNNKVRIAGCELQMDSNMMALTPNADIESEFLYYMIVFKQLYKIADTSTIPQINNKHIIPYKICLPPINEQKRIVKVLSEWDKAIELQTKIIDRLELRKRAMMQRLLTGRVHLNGLHKEWNWVKAGEIFYNSTKRASDGEQLLSSTQEHGVIPRTMLDTRVTMPSGNAIENFKSVESGDFIISLRSFQGGIEYSNYGGCVSPAYTVLKPKHIINKVFYQYYFKSVEFISRLAVAVIGIRDGRQINFNDFSFVKIPEPPLEEQDAIAKVFTTADKEIEKEKLKLSFLRNQKRGLMQQLLTGKKRIGLWQKN